jgi:hypothetical protein
MVRALQSSGRHRQTDRRSSALDALNLEPSVAKYMVKRRGSPSQGWTTFLHNHAPDISAMDPFVVPTVGFRPLYAFVIIRLDRRDLVWINTTTNPTAEWVARRIKEAFPWNEAPRYMIRDRDHIYGAIVTPRLRAMGIRDTTPARHQLTEILTKNTRLATGSSPP